MQTECSAERFGFAPVGRREVVANFEGGSITSDGEGLLVRNGWTGFFRRRRPPRFLGNARLSRPRRPVEGSAVQVKLSSFHSHRKHGSVVDFAVDYNCGIAAIFACFTTSSNISSVSTPVFVL